MARRATRSWLPTSVLLTVAACSTFGGGPAFLVEHDWAGHGEWIVADTHVHTRASDGGYTIAEVVARAREHGCQAVAITDHADRTLRAATPEYFADIAAARAAHPDLIVLAGLEWNVPPSGGDEHATLLLPPDGLQDEVMAEFKQRWDDYDRGTDEVLRAEDALTWLAGATFDFEVSPVVIYNHPSRSDETSLSNADDLVRWRGANDLAIGFEGAPGHQGKPPIGSYKGKVEPIDRWDPVVAGPGDAWDRLLQQGLSVHGAVASSDFHNDNPRDLNDFWPCAFAETWYFVPERSAAGVLRAMRAGTFFGVHGHIARQVELTISAEGLPRPAIVGESIRVPAGTALDASVALTIPPTDFQGRPNRVDQVELIVVTPSDVLVKTQAIGGSGPQSATETLVASDGGLVVRARVRRIVPDGPDLMAYTNAVRVEVR
jgi:hypothetical protein